MLLSEGHYVINEESGTQIGGEDLESLRAAIAAFQQRHPDLKLRAFQVVEIDMTDLEKAPDQPLCPHCLAGKELLRNEPGGLKPRASYWHEADNPEDDMIECPRWREHEIVKLNEEIQTLRGHLERIMCKQS
jgi:hypothetical protein